MAIKPCPSCGSRLVPKEVTGGLTGGLICIHRRACAECHRALQPHMTRYSCKPCDYHLCDTCAKRTPPRVVHIVEQPVGNEVSAERPLCRFGAACYNHDPEHRRTMRHPEVEEGITPGLRLACKFGSQCYRKNPEHLEQFVHPGDRNYRVGLVHFKDGQYPEFDNLWQLFQYHDPDESGHLSREEFDDLCESISLLEVATEIDDVDQAWADAQGPMHGYINFRQFVAWTKDCLQLEYPLGLEGSGDRARPCRFRLLEKGGARCSCPAFKPQSGAQGNHGASLCSGCGHKASMHRSDLAQRTFSQYIEEDVDEPHWAPDEEGLVHISDPAVLARLQVLLDKSHKPAPDNWTRDRGCTQHGVNGCGAACAFKHRLDVPSGYKLVFAFRNQNHDLWQKYRLVRTAIAEECSRECEVPHEVRSVVTAGRVLEAELDESVNEWFLFHGSEPEKCVRICASNFRLALAGQGATWKDPGSERGTPLYGFGIYMAERITKADEYSWQIPARGLATEPRVPAEDEDGEPLFTVLLCRVLGGRTNVVTTNEIEVEKLRMDVFEGAYNSVFGDRVTSLGKPYREVVVYDKDQCYPEYLLVYKRLYDG